MNILRFAQPVFTLLSANLWGMEGLDFFIIGVLIFYAIEGILSGFLVSSVDFITFVLSFILSLSFYAFIARLLSDTFSLSIGFANALGFFLVAFISETFFNILFKKLLRVFLLKHPITSSNFNKFNYYLGFLPGMASAIVLLSFILTIVVSLPVSSYLKQLVTESKIGSLFIVNTASFEKDINTIFGSAISETMNFLTVEPRSDERLSLHFTYTDGTIDQNAEQQMFLLVNQQRIANGKEALLFDSRLTELARNYSKDMFVHGYFSHYNLEGKSPFDRMEQFGISYQSAGENLALAPSVDLAMQGLMQSPGHRANILSDQFHKVGIGVIDGGIYGKMFTQEFTD